MVIYEEITGTKILRKLAKTLVESICSFAEANKLSGDIATRLDITLAEKKEERLSEKERAWACSFCQNYKDLDIKAGDRLRGLLDEDYRNRFSSKKKTPKEDDKEKGEAAVAEPSKEQEGPNERPKGFLKSPKKNKK